MNFLEESTQTIVPIQFTLACESSTNSIYVSNQLSDEMSLQEYIDTKIEPLESLKKSGMLTLKPTLKYSEISDEDWAEIKAIANTPDVSKHSCIQATYSYGFYIYNSPKHGLVEITRSNWTGNFSSVTPISFEYLVSNFRPQELKMTFNRYLSMVASGFTDGFITNPTLEMNDSINALVESKKDEIKTFYEKSYEFDENPETHLQSLYIKIGTIDTVQYFVTKTKLYMKDYDSSNEYLILIAQLDEHSFVSTHLHLSS